MQSKLAVANSNQELKYKNREMQRAFAELEAGLDRAIALTRTTNTIIHHHHGSSAFNISEKEVVQEEMEKAKQLSLALQVSECSI